MILKQLIKYENAPAIEATWVDEDGAVIKCHAYSNGQMNELRADLGTDAAAHEALIAEVDVTYVPPEPAPPQVPQSVTMRQARLALLGAGLLDGVDAAIAALPSPQKEAAKIEWGYSQEVQRHNGFVSVLAPLLSLTEAQIDALFIGAAKL